MPGNFLPVARAQRGGPPVADGLVTFVFMFESPDVLDGLNDEQRQAVVHPGGPLLVLAGAGTGKTRTLVARAAWLCEQGVQPSRILLLTFTRRAADDMLSRAAGVPGRPAGGSPAGPSTRSRTGSSASTPSRFRCRPSSPSSTRRT